MAAHKSVEQRFTEKVRVEESGCHQWLASLASPGYGKFSVDGRYHLAHRYAYEIANGPIPKGLTIDHLCRNRGCVNPEHMEPVTIGENVLRSPLFIGHVKRARTHCPRGHEAHQRASVETRTENHSRFEHVS